MAVHVAERDGAVTGFEGSLPGQGVKRSFVASAGVPFRPPTAYNSPPTLPTPSAARAVGVAVRLVHALAPGW